MICVVVANTNNCRIYNYDKGQSQLALVKEISHPENREKASANLTSERPGHYQKGESSRGAYSPHMNPKEVEIDNFAREIAQALDHGRNENSFKNLIVITAPHMNGLLHQHMNKHVKEMVINNIQKDIQHMNEGELAEFLKSHAQYPDQH